MKRKIEVWRIWIITGLSASSVLIYGLQLYIFKTPRETLFYFLQDLAFIPLQVLFVTLLIDQLLSKHEKSNVLDKIYMVIGVYFSESGMTLIQSFSSFDGKFNSLKENLLIDNRWNDSHFKLAGRIVAEHHGNIDSRFSDLKNLTNLLKTLRPFHLTLLENPNLLEHQNFTDMLWSVFHLTDELIAREKEKHLPESDYAHLSVDIQRAYLLMLGEWLKYMKHLKEAYPYLYSFAIRKNPFGEKSSIIIHE